VRAQNELGRTHCRQIGEAIAAAGVPVSGRNTQMVRIEGLLKELSRGSAAYRFARKNEPDLASHAVGVFP
jgi:hypothetical protein